ncbi:transmembrane and TPR repeat-containing protein CG4050-like [Limulus polyphemus]|uniref:dolichyl-phosphate-mannose--protein mannosyltransferase n=1 Tax=Limulus polyphemus TaxID=6850 RepID=A0ABM1T094_LIMPO|nr:transmembrane and TPR repeat-containing protein CG4050-like [Limulus polyphemus]
MTNMHKLIITVTAIIVQMTSLRGGLVFDDIAAIRENRDVRSTMSCLSLFFNDFWGTPLHKEQSHKSYRPLTVLTFRLNYIFHGLHPLGYHVVNVLLHVVVCLLFHRMCNLFLSQLTSFVAALLFSVHPIHTEAVASVVGRAELLSAIFFICAFIRYVQEIRKREYKGWRCCVETLTMGASGMFCKEQCLTVLIVCSIYDLAHHMPLEKRMLSPWIRQSLWRVGFLIMSAGFLLTLRLKLMGWNLPVFNRFDNPASAASYPVRHLTYNYLLSQNIWLLLFPYDLCCDWTMGTIPLVERFSDVRNINTIAMYVSFVSVLSVATLRGKERKSHLAALCVLVIPFIPASNLFHPVGFVLAERVLYIPSMGFCMLVATGWTILWRGRARMLAVTALLLLIISHGFKTAYRNLDWYSDYTLFSSALKVTQRNAKIFNNLGKALDKQSRHDEALYFYQQAIRVQPDDIRGYLNAGNVLTRMKRYQKAEDMYLKAKSLLHPFNGGTSRVLRVTQSYLQVLVSLASLLSLNSTRLEEADNLYREVISIRTDFTEAYVNRGNLLLKLNRSKEAETMYCRALEFDQLNPDIYHNLGVILIDQGRNYDALSFFNKALEIDPDHGPALMNSAILIQESNMPPGDQRIANERLQKIVNDGKENELVYFNLGKVALERKDLALAEEWFRKALEVRPHLKSALFNLALLMTEQQRPQEAILYLRKLLETHPDHMNALILIADIYVNHFKDLKAAKQCYKKILRINPRHMQGLHNLCVVYYQAGELREAELCFLNAVNLHPKVEYIQRHLEITRKQLRSISHHPRNPSKVKISETESSSDKQVSSSPTSER